MERREIINNYKALRKSIGITQKQAARALYLTEGTYRQLEAHRMTPSSRIISEISGSLLTGKIEVNPQSEVVRKTHEMGLVIGDRIIGRENLGPRNYVDTILCLVWRGEQVCVWRVWERHVSMRRWVDLGEKSNWTLETRSWRKL